MFLLYIWQSNNCLLLKIVTKIFTKYFCARWSNCILQTAAKRSPTDRELLKLMPIFLGSKPPCDTKFRAPGPMHQARWMAKAIYSLKVSLFTSQFKLTSCESNGLSRLNIYLAKIYAKFWFCAPVAATAPKALFTLHTVLRCYVCTEEHSSCAS